MSAPPYIDNQEKQPLMGYNPTPNQGPPPPGYQPAGYPPQNGPYEYQANVYGGAHTQYYQPPPPVHQQTDTNIVVVQNQPSATTTTYVHSARDAQARGDEAGRQSNACISLCCNISAILWVILLLVAAALALFIPRQFCYYDYDTDETVCYYGSVIGYLEYVQNND